MILGPPPSKIKLVGLFSHAYQPSLGRRLRKDNVIAKTEVGVVTKHVSHPHQPSLPHLHTQLTRKQAA